VLAPLLGFRGKTGILRDYRKGRKAVRPSNLVNGGVKALSKQEKGNGGNHRRPFAGKWYSSASSLFKKKLEWKILFLQETNSNDRGKDSPQETPARRCQPSHGKRGDVMLATEKDHKRLGKNGFAG